MGNSCLLASSPLYPATVSSPQIAVNSEYTEKAAHSRKYRVLLQREIKVDMMMGTKSAGPMRRTTSMTEFAPPDVLAGVAEEEAMAVAGEETDRLQVHEEEEEEIAYGRIGSGVAAYRARPAAAHRRNSADFSAAAVETAAFLRACGLCNRRLGPGRDTFMYRGDSAFCSLECRQQHIAHEEWKGKCALAAPVVATVEPAAASSVDQPTAGGTLAAA